MGPREAMWTNIDRFLTTWCHMAHLVQYGLNMVQYVQHGAIWAQMAHVGHVGHMGHMTPYQAILAHMGPPGAIWAKLCPLELHGPGDAI